MGSLGVLVPVGLVGCARRSGQAGGRRPAPRARSDARAPSRRAPPRGAHGEAEAWPHPAAGEFQEALRLARSADHNAARRALEEHLREAPWHVKAYITLAQVEKRSAGYDPSGHRAGRRVLVRGLRKCPGSGELLQAWALTELQLGNSLAATVLLEAAVGFEPALADVLRWQPVRQARREHFSAGVGRVRQVRRTIWAAAGGGQRGPARAPRRL